MAEISIFKTPVFGEVRTTLSASGEPLFCLADVCKALGLRQGDVSQRLDKGVVSTQPLETAGGTQQANFVNEDGLYDVILDSRKPEAKQFRKWVTGEVLPSIRKNGGYIATNVPSYQISDPITRAQRWIDEEKERQSLLADNMNQQAQIIEEAPKVNFANAIITSKSSCLIGELAKLITQNGVETGQNRLFDWMRENGYLGKRGENRNIPNTLNKACSS